MTQLNKEPQSTQDKFTGTATSRYQVQEHQAMEEHLNQTCLLRENLATHVYELLLELNSLEKANLKPLDQYHPFTIETSSITVCFP